MTSVYNFALLVEKGFEETCIKEFEEIINKKSDFEIIKLNKLSIIILKKINFEDLIKLSYISRVIHDAIILLSFSDLKNLEEVLNNIEIPFEFSKFKIKLIKDNRKYGITSKYIYEKLKKYSKKEGIKIVFKSYIIENKFIIGISPSESIGKRKYKVINYENSINPISISTFLKYLEISESNILVVPTKDGTIPIEIGIYLKNIPANFWSKKDFYMIDDLNYLIRIDEMIIRKSKAKIYSVDDFSKNILISKKNALNGMVKDIIFFKRANLDYLDLIIDKKFDIIFVDLYKTNKNKIKELLYSSRNLIDDNGKIVVISDKEILKNSEFFLKKLNLNIVNYKKTTYLNDVKKFYVLRKNNF